MAAVNGLEMRAAGRDQDAKVAAADDGIEVARKGSVGLLARADWLIGRGRYLDQRRRRGGGIRGRRPGDPAHAATIESAMNSPKMRITAILASSTQVHQVHQVHRVHRCMADRCRSGCGMNRREFLGAMAVAPVAMRGMAVVSASRTFEITTRIELEESHDAAVAWVPLPLTRTAPYQIDRGHTVGGNADKTRVERVPGSDAAVLVAEWGHMMPPPELIVTMRVETSDYRVSLAAAEWREAHRRSRELPEAHRSSSRSTASSSRPPTRSRKARRPIWRRRARSTTGSSRTPFAIRR